MSTYSSSPSTFWTSTSQGLHETSDPGHQLYKVFEELHDELTQDLLMIRYIARYSSESTAEAAEETLLYGGHLREVNEREQKKLKNAIKDRLQEYFYDLSEKDIHTYMGGIDVKP